MSSFEEIGYTSDHIAQYIDVIFNDITIKGYTWNIQRKCNKSNNPFKMIESNITYKNRKLHQFKHLLQDDFAFIQEADFIESNALLHNLFEDLFQ